jgi:hypothetical protein
VRHRFVISWLCLLVLPACSRLDGLAFREDTRVDVVTPRDRAKVTLPVTVRWASKATVPRYGVFVDRSPMPPGKRLDWFARNDEACQGTAGCPSTEYLAERNVFSTTGRSFTVERLLDTQRDVQRREFHEVTIVLLDAGGRRMGESAWSVEFQVTRDRD